MYMKTCAQMCGLAGLPAAELDGFHAFRELDPDRSGHLDLSSVLASAPPADAPSGLRHWLQKSGRKLVVKPRNADDRRAPDVEWTMFPRTATGSFAFSREAALAVYKIGAGVSYHFVYDQCYNAPDGFSTVTRLFAHPNMFNMFKPTVCAPFLRSGCRGLQVVGTVGSTWV